MLTVGWGAQKLLHEACPNHESDEDALERVHEGLLPLLNVDAFHAMPTWTLTDTVGLCCDVRRQPNNMSRKRQRDSEGRSELRSATTMRSGTS
eukprot:13323712-Alexandrium_andersonii.AAC.1